MTKRADQLLVQQGLAESRTQAQRWINEAKVSWLAEDGWHLLSKPSHKLSDDVELRVERDESDRFVSRGGLKLAAALQDFKLDVKGWHCIDIGASTGGFTDCLLQAGAAFVCCVDVGHEQLHPRLQDDSRVVSHEGINARQLPAELKQHASTGYDMAVMDVSFISQCLILPELPELLCDGAAVVTLVKPQFEVGADKVGKGGIVRDDSLYAEVEQKVRSCCAGAGIEVRGFIPSPIEGGDGNREFLLYGICRKYL